MDEQTVVSGQIPQFDPGATPVPPQGGSEDGQPQAPGMVVEPTIVEPNDDQTLNQLEQAISSPSDEASSLPPPPFEDPVGGIQPAMPSVAGTVAPVAPGDMNPQAAPTTEDLVLPTLGDISPAVAETPVVEASAPIESATSEELRVEEPEVSVEETPLVVEETVAEEPEAEPLITVTDPASAREVQGDLDLIKQQALKELAPIANKLDQEPVDRFHTLLELIQATDSHDLVQSAFESAQAIEEDRDRATALLNLVNEVNYLEKLEKGEVNDEDRESKEGSDKEN